MVVVLELDGDDAFDPYSRPKGLEHSAVTIRPTTGPHRSEGERVDAEAQRPNPNVNNVSQALGCYP